MALNQLENNADIIDHALDLVNEKTDGTSEYEDQALSLLREGLQTLVEGGTVFGVDIDEEWLWLQKSTPGTITMQPKIPVTFSSLKGSQSIDFGIEPVASIDTNVKGWFFKPTSESDIYRIATHDASAHYASIDSVYTGATVSTGDGKVFKLEYNLPSDFLRFYAPIRVQRDRQREITVGTEEALDRDWPILDIESGVPTRAAFADNNTLRFNRYADKEMIRLELPYIFDPKNPTNATTDTLPCSVSHYGFFKYFIAYFLAILKKETDKKDTFKELAASALSKMIASNRRIKKSGQRNLGKIIPRQGELDRFNRPVRTSGGFIITG